MVSKKNLFYVSVALPILLLFLVLNFFHALQRGRELRNFIHDYELPALGLAAGAQLDLIAAEYKEAGYALLQEGFIKSWILEGEENEESLREFMETVRIKYGLMDTSVVSNLTETYYGTDGRTLKLDPEKWERDGWYYLYREEVKGINIDTWHYPETGVIGMYVNVPIFDNQGKYLGVTGGGIDTDVFSTILRTFEDDRNVQIYMARRDGRLVYATDRSLMRGTPAHLDEVIRPGVHEQLIREQNSPTGLSLGRQDSAESIVWGRFLPDWDTFIVVERCSEQLKHIQTEAIFRSMGVGGFLAVSLFGMTLLVLYIARKKMGLELAAVESRSKYHKALAWAYNKQLEYGEAELSKAGSYLMDSENQEAVGKTLLAVVSAQRKVRHALGGMAGSDQVSTNSYSFALYPVLQEILLRCNTAACAKDAAVHISLSADIKKEGPIDITVRGGEALFSFLLEELFNHIIEQSPDGAEIFTAMFLVKEAQTQNPGNLGNPGKTGTVCCLEISVLNIWIRDKPGKNSFLEPPDQIVTALKAIGVEVNYTFKHADSTEKRERRKSTPVLRLFLPVT